MKMRWTKYLLDMIGLLGLRRFPMPPTRPSSRAVSINLKFVGDGHPISRDNAGANWLDQPDVKSRRPGHQY